MPENVRDYGPLQEFWTFLFERINKVLKSFNSSNHSGGELETSFFREFHRTVQNSRIVCNIHELPGNDLIDFASSRKLQTALWDLPFKSPRQPCTKLLRTTEALFRHSQDN